MKFLPIVLLALASMAEAKPSFAARDQQHGALRKLSDSQDEQQDEQQDDQQDAQEDEQEDQEAGEEYNTTSTAPSTAPITTTGGGQTDYSSGYYTGNKNGGNYAWSGTDAWYKYNQVQEADDGDGDGEQKTKSNSLQFQGCHTFTTTSSNVAADGEDVNGYYYGNGDAKHSSTKSYVVMTAPYKKRNGDSNGGDLMEVSIPLTEYVAMLVSNKETEHDNLCTECSNLVSYCLPIESSYMGVPGSTKNTNNDQMIYWDQPWDYRMSEEANMGDYYGVPGAINCNACMANSCYSENDESMIAYMAENVYSYSDLDMFYEDILRYNGSAQVEYIEEMSEALEMFSTCSEIDGTDYYSGWTCTSKGNGIQLAVFADDECANYIRGTSYFDIAANEDLEKFTAAMEVLSIDDDLNSGVACADKTWTTGSNIAYGGQSNQNQYQYNNYEENNNGYMNVNNMNEVCANVVQVLVEGELDLYVCENPSYQSHYQNQQAQNQDQEYTYSQQSSTDNAELDLNALSGGDVSTFCELMSKKFGSAKGNKQMKNDWRSAFVNSDLVTKIKKKVASMGAGEIAFWSVFAIAGAATLIAAIVMLFKFNGDDDRDKLFDDNALESKLVDDNTDESSTELQADGPSPEADYECPPEPDYAEYTLA
jgi:hypothetical protein